MCVFAEICYPFGDFLLTSFCSSIRSRYECCCWLICVALHVQFFVHLTQCGCMEGIAWICCKSVHTSICPSDDLSVLVSTFASIHPSVQPFIDPFHISLFTVVFLYSIKVEKSFAVVRPSVVYYNFLRYFLFLQFLFFFHKRRKVVNRDFRLFSLAVCRCKCCLGLVAADVGRCAVPCRWIWMIP